MDSRWPEIEASIDPAQRHAGDDALREPFLECVAHAVRQMGPDYLRVIGALTGEQKQNGAQWLQGIVEAVAGRAMALYGDA